MKNKLFGPTQKFENRRKTHGARTKKKGRFDNKNDYDFMHAHYIECRCVKHYAIPAKLECA